MHRSVLNVLLAGTILATAFSVPVMAQDGLIEQIVVTARKRSESLQEVPMSASAFSEQTLKNAGVSQATDLIQLAPGATVIDNGSNNRREIVLRGAGTGRLANTESANGLYRDDTFVGGGSFGGRSFSRLDLFDIERVEVLRGPQGALYGRNAVGGAINIITKKPEFTFGGKVTAAAGINNLWDTSLIVNVPLIDDTLAVRAGGIIARQTGGFYTVVTPAVNPLVPAEYQPRAKGDRMEFDAFRFSVLYKPVESFSIRVMADQFRDEGPESNLKGYDAVGGTGGPFAQFRPPEAPYIRVRDTADVQKVRESNAILSISWDLGFGTLSSVSGYKQRLGTQTTDIDATTLSLFTAPPRPSTSPVIGKQRGAFKQRSSELRLVSADDGGPLTWLIGGDYLDFTDNLSNFIYGDTTVLRGLGALGRTIAAGTIMDDTPVKANSWAVFASAEYRFTPEFSGAIEARYTQDEKTINSARRRGDGVIVPILTNNLNRTISNSEVTPGATLRYKLTPDATVYLRFATAARPGGFNFNRGTWVRTPDPVPVSYGPEKTRVFEAGARTSWFDGALLANLSVYRQHYTDLVANRQQNDEGPFPQQVNWLVNAGDSDVDGAELELAGRFPTGPGGMLTTRVALATQSGKIKNSKLPTVILNGSKPTFLRDLQSSVGLDYSQELGSGYKLLAGTSLYGEFGGITSPTQQIPRKDYFLVNGYAAIEWNDLSLRADVRNIFDEQHYVIRQSSPLDRSNTVNEPRTWRVEVTYKF